MNERNPPPRVRNIIDSENRHRLQGIYSQANQVTMDLFYIALSGRLSATRREEMAVNLESLAARIRRLPVIE